MIPQYKNKTYNPFTCHCIPTSFIVRLISYPPHNQTPGIVFNMFLSQLLYELDGVNNGLRVGDQLYNSFAYADDVSLVASTVSGLQELIDTQDDKLDL